VWYESHFGSHWPRPKNMFQWSYVEKWGIVLKANIRATRKRNPFTNQIVAWFCRFFAVCDFSHD
jgi:hypothetical protein